MSDLEIHILHNDPVTMERLFPKESIENAALEIDYFISFDFGEKPDAAAYCLARKQNGTIEILLAKSSHDKEALEEEAKNLTKYFNAKPV